MVHLLLIVGVVVGGPRWCRCSLQPSSRQVNWLRLQGVVAVASCGPHAPHDGHDGHGHDVMLPICAKLPQMSSRAISRP